MNNFASQFGIPGGWELMTIGLVITLVVLGNEIAKWSHICLSREYAIVQVIRVSIVATCTFIGLMVAAADFSFVAWRPEVFAYPVEKCGVIYLMHDARFVRLFPFYQMNGSNKWTYHFSHGFLCSMQGNRIKLE